MLTTVIAIALTSLPQSKLGPHVLGNVHDANAQTILLACPRVAKWLTPDGSVAGEIAAYRTRCPGGVVVLRVYLDNSTHYSTSDGAQASADDYWNKMQTGLSGLGAAQVDWLEGPNELDNLPDWYHDSTASQWISQFWSRLADRMNTAGFHPLVASIAVGNPSLAGENGAGSPNFFQPLADAMKAKTYRWGWSYHAYTKDLTTDVPTEVWYSLRYRRIRTECGLEGVPLVLTEGGQDMPTGWQGRGVTATQFMSWLEWFDARMREDDDVVGITLFQVGEHGTWQNFDLGPVATSLATWLTGSIPDGGTPADAGAHDAGAPDAGHDAGVPDAGPVDAGADGGDLPVADAGGEDGGVSDAGVDAGVSGILGVGGGCGCRTATAGPVLPLLALLLARRPRR